MLSILGWLFMGLFAGSIGQAFLPGGKPGRIEVPMLMSICDALIGGLMVGSPFKAGYGELAFVTSLALALLGSVMVLAVRRLMLSRNFRSWLSTRCSPIRKAVFRPKVSGSEEVTSLSAEI